MIHSCSYQSNPICRKSAPQLSLTCSQPDPHQDGVSLWTSPVWIFSSCCHCPCCSCNSSFYRKIEPVLFINWKRQVSAPAVRAQANPPFAVSYAIWRCYCLFRVQATVPLLEVTISKALMLDKAIQTTSDELRSATWVWRVSSGTLK